jgi:hypothetical protein
MTSCVTVRVVMTDGELGDRRVGLDEQTAIDLRWLAASEDGR